MSKNSIICNPKHEIQCSIIVRTKFRFFNNIDLSILSSKSQTFLQCTCRFSRKDSNAAGGGGRARRNHSSLELEYYGTFKSVCSSCSSHISRDKYEHTHLRLWIMYGIWLHKSHTPLGGRRSCFTMNETDHNIIHT